MAQKAKKRKTQKPLWLLDFSLAERVGFEPTCGVNHKLISSQPRYDRFDTAPCIFSSEGSSKFKKVLERTDGENYKNFQIRTHEKLRKSKENADTKRTVCGGISSQPRYDRFDTAPLEFCGIISAIRQKIKDFQKNLFPVLYVCQ